MGWGKGVLLIPFPSLNFDQIPDSSISLAPDIIPSVQQSKFNDQFGVREIQLYQRKTGRPTSHFSLSTSSNSASWQQNDRNMVRKGAWKQNYGSKLSVHLTLFKSFHLKGATILEHRAKKNQLNSLNSLWTVLAHFGKRKCENAKKVSLIFFLQFATLSTQYVCGQRISRTTGPLFLSLLIKKMKRK